MRDVPRAREDGRCVECGKRKKMPNPPQRGVDVGIYLAEPFCSSQCARAYYGTQLRSSAPGAQGRWDRKQEVA
jgi:hypothetical protein